MAVHHQGVLAVYSVSLSKTNSVVGVALSGQQTLVELHASRM